MCREAAPPKRSELRQKWVGLMVSLILAGGNAYSAVKIIGFLSVGVSGANTGYALAHSRGWG